MLLTEFCSKAPVFIAQLPVIEVPGATPTEPVKIVVKAPLNDTAVPAWTAKFLQLPRGIDTLSGDNIVGRREGCPLGCPLGCPVNFMGRMVTMMDFVFKMSIENSNL